MFNGPVNNSNYGCSDGITVSADYSVSQSCGSVNISEAARNVAFAIVFRQLIEAEVDSNAAPGGDFFNFSSGVNDSYNGILLNTTHPDLSIKDDQVNLTYPGSLYVLNTISTSSIAGSLPYLPRTHYTENSTTFDLIVQNFPYRSANSRIILEMYIVSGPSLQAAGDVKKKHWIDDEYTPSVFETFTYPFGDSYLQWKPISYQSQSRQSTASQQANYLAYGGLQPSDQGELPRGLASAVFRPGANVTRFYMVIGTPGDGTYLSTAYFTWTAVIGFGTPPTEHISTTAIITLCVGFGLPMATVLLGGVYVVLKRKPWMYLYSLVVSARMKRSSFVPVVNEASST
eukprot:Em0009g1281a